MLYGLCSDEMTFCGSFLEPGNIPDYLEQNRLESICVSESPLKMNNDFQKVQQKV